MISKYKASLLIVLITMLLASLLSCAPDEPRFTYKEIETYVRKHCVPYLEEYLWENGVSTIMSETEAIDPWVSLYLGGGEWKVKGIVVERYEYTGEVSSRYATTWIATEIKIKEEIASKYGAFKEIDGEPWDAKTRLIGCNRLWGGILECDWVGVIYKSD
jgi:hypothetical protein